MNRSAKFYGLDIALHGNILLPSLSSHLYHDGWAFSLSPLRSQLTQLYSINEYLVIDSGGNVSDLVLALNCSLARMLPGEAELVSE